MEFDVKIITGPRTASVTKDKAEATLKNHPEFPKGAHVALSEVEGHWVAAISTPKDEAPITKEAAPPAFLENDGAPDADNQASPKPDEDSGPPSPEGDSEETPEDKPEGDKEPKGEKGLDHAVHQLTDLVTQIATALGIGGDANPVPGLDEGPPGGPPGPPGGPAAGPDGPPPGPPGRGSEKQHMVHERALKPGEAPPGTTPIGSPSFASVHPWASLDDKIATFKVAEQIGDTPASEVFSELTLLASEVGRSVRQFRVDEEDGHRVAKALISKY